LVGAEGAKRTLRLYVSIDEDLLGDRIGGSHTSWIIGTLRNGVVVFTREYTQCTAGYTFCFVVVVGGPLIKLASISANS
jgi:hypothetical protein